jgi:hypothetical protein
MPQAILTSNKFPGISLFCPDAPDTLQPQPGSYMFFASVPRAVTKATQGAIENQLYNFPPEVKAHINITFSADVEEVIDPVVEEEVIEESTTVEEVITLTDEDMDLIQIEISKLQGKSAADAEPILIATGGNEELPKALRIKYLQMVVIESGLPKALKAVARKLIEQL